MPDTETVKAPTIPGELWMIWDRKGWICSIDDAFGGPTYLVAFSEAEAKVAAAHQDELYDLACIPVRVK